MSVRWWWKKTPELSPIEKLAQEEGRTTPYVPAKRAEYEVFSDEFEWELCEKRYVYRDYYERDRPNYLPIAIKPTGKWKIVSHEDGTCWLYLEVADTKFEELDYMAGRGGMITTTRWVREDRLTVESKPNETINNCGE